MAREASARASAKVTYRLRDWVFSRQRYWGEPIPIYFPVDDRRRPRAARRRSSRFTTTSRSPFADERAARCACRTSTTSGPATIRPGPLARAVDWRFFQKDGRWFARETNTMPQWAGSCWYYLRFSTRKTTREAWSQKAYDDWMPVDLYVGGGEHAVLHLLYARFWHKVLFDLGVVKDSEPFMKLVHQGMILGENSEKMSQVARQRRQPGRRRARLRRRLAARLRDVHGAARAGEALADERHRGGAALSRAHLERGHRAAHATTPAAYDDGDAAPGPQDHPEGDARHRGAALQHRDQRHDDPRQAPRRRSKAVPREAARDLALLVSPFAPHLGEELWQPPRARATSLAYAPWPEFDPALVKDDVVEIGVQVNGKLRGDDHARRRRRRGDRARGRRSPSRRVRAHLEGKTVKKFIYVKGKIVNFIVG